MKPSLENKFVFVLGAMAGAIIGFLTNEYLIKPLTERLKG